MLFKISPALTNTKHNEMALLETAASDPEKGDEMSFIWLNQWQNIIFFPFFQGGRRANKWSLQHKGHMIHSVSSWEQGRAGTRIWSQRFHHLNCLVTSDEKRRKKVVQRYYKAENLNSTFFFFWLTPPGIIFLVWQVLFTGQWGFPKWSLSLGC